MADHQLPLNADTFHRLGKDDQNSVMAWLRKHGIDPLLTFEIEVLEGWLRAHCYTPNEHSKVFSILDTEWVEVVSVLPPPPDTFQRWLNVAREDARRG